MDRAEIAHLLPEVFRRTATPGSPLAALLEVMEVQHAPSEDVLKQLDRFFDPYRAPAYFLPFLARWVDLGWLLEPQASGGSERALSSGVGHLRELIASAMYLSRWKGTAQGLIGFLEAATGCSGFHIDEMPLGEDGRQRPFHMRVHVPEDAEPFRGLIRQIVDVEKPAYVTWEFGREDGPPVGDSGG